MAVALLSTSCNEQELSVLPDSPTKFVPSYTTDFRGYSFIVQDGRITFSSEKDLRGIINEIAKNNGEAVKKFSNLPGFTSSRDAYLKLMDDESMAEADVDKYPKILRRRYYDGDVYIDHTVDDVALEHLANQDGILVAGSQVYDFSARQHPVKVPLQDYVFDDPTFKAHTHPHAQALRVDRREGAMMKVNIVTCEDEFDRKDRSKVVGQLEDTFIPLRSGDNDYELRVRTRFYRKSLGIYWGRQADDLRSNWDLWIHEFKDDIDLGFRRLQGSHVAQDGDQQNTRAVILYHTGEQTSFAGNREGRNSSLNIARYNGQSGSCECRLNR